MSVTAVIASEAVGSATQTNFGPIAGTSTSSHQRVALLIGSVNRLGLEVARLLGREGLHVVLTGETPEDGAPLVERLLLEGVAATYRSLDPDREEDVASLSDDLQAAYGCVDVAVYQSATGAAHRADVSMVTRLLASDPELVAGVIGRTVSRVVSLSRTLLPVMRTRGAGRMIHIIPEHRTQSDDPRAPSPDGFTVSTIVSVLVNRMGAELAQHGVKINGVALASPQVHRRADPGEWLIQRCAQQVVRLATQAEAPQGKIFYSE